MNFNYFPGLLLEQEHNCIYGRLVVDSATKQKLKKFCRDNKIPLENAMEFHCTVVYDERLYAFQYFDDLLKIFKQKNPVIQRTNISAAVLGVDYFGKNKECLVMKLNCTGAHKLFDIYNGPNRFSYSYNPYIPHVTLQYNANNIILSDKAIDELKQIKINFDRFILEKEGTPPDTISESISLNTAFNIKLLKEEISNFNRY